MRIVIIIVRARPMRSPSMPKIRPPVAQPAMKIDVALPPRRPRVLPQRFEGFGVGVCWGGKQVFHCRRPREHEELLVHRVKKPAHGGDGQHEPVVAGHFRVPGAARLPRDHWSVVKAMHELPVPQVRHAFSAGPCAFEAKKCITTVPVRRAVCNSAQVAWRRGNG